MEIQFVTTLPQLRKLEAEWNQLAGHNPFASFDWASAWWEHMGTDSQLYVLVGRTPATNGQAGSVVGIAPWFIGDAERLDRVVQFLGSGKACSDHLSLLTTDEHRLEFASACAHFLDEANRQNDPQQHWEYLDLVGCDANDDAINVIQQTLADLRYQISMTAGVPCFSIDMSQGWDAYLASRSSNTRRHLRKLLAVLDLPNVRVQLLTTPTELESYWPTFVDLHQRRREDVKDSGCFEHPGFNEFLLSATLKLAERDLVRMCLVFVDDTPVSVSHSIVGGDCLFNYQSGMDPNFGEYRPGFLALASILRRVESMGLKHLDLLRGNEPYKQRWRAIELPTMQLRVPARKPKALVIHQLWRTKERFKSLIQRDAIEVKP